ncbi:MAG TPA: M23 family metallopeptidase, partial [Thermoanaerobaculia bacterium]|nr:M23 family metallopeptidase [Thermoanaerobaculia bacterium]
LAGCATFPGPAVTAGETTAKGTAEALPDDDDFSQLIAQLRSDLNRYNGREIARKPTITPSAATSRSRDREFADRARALFAPLNGTGLHMPVVGVRHHDLDDSWHAPRDGGSRLHKGIDIFAPRGTAVVAVADGFVSFIGDQPKGGHCIWLTTENGISFYYAHLDRWAPGLYEGMEVHSGDLLGFVGNTGNASRTPPHLHFAVNLNDEMVNPYPLLTRAVLVARARMPVELGGGLGTR